LSLRSKQKPALKPFGYVFANGYFMLASGLLLADC